MSQAEMATATSAFEILGPIMVGPSSSHTAGALRIAALARSLAPDVIMGARFGLYNSFAKTYKGHGTDRALVAGLLGLDCDDTHVRDSLDMARERGLEIAFDVRGEDAGLHPNTVDVELTCAGGLELCLRGESLGGGRVRAVAVDGIAVNISGEVPTLFITHWDRPGVLAALTGILAAAHANIATMATYRSEAGGQAFTVVELDEMPSPTTLELMMECADVVAVNHVHVPGTGTGMGAGEHTSAPLELTSGAVLLKTCTDCSKSIGDVMREREEDLSGVVEAHEGMRRVIAVMRDESRATIAEPERSLGGLLYGQARQVASMDASLASTLMGTTLTRAVSYAMATLERSASMGVICAAPTAGSAGVVPGVLLSASEALGDDDEQLASALWCAAAVGSIVARNASVSGAEGGCQAEVGTAAAMAAAGLVQLCGGTPKQALDAASVAISNLLGLVCDPVRGLVEHPCQLRNAIGVNAAVSSGQIVLAGVRSPIPFDEVVGAMAAVGASLPVALSETAAGGLAACATCEACGGCQ